MPSGTGDTKSEHIRQLLDLGASVAEAARQAGAHYSYAHSVATRYRKEKAEAEGRIVRPKLQKLKPKARAQQARAITVRKLSAEPDPTIAPVKTPNLDHRRDAGPAGSSPLPRPTLVNLSHGQPEPMEWPKPRGHRRDGS